MSSRKSFTEEEDNYIRSNYLAMSYRDIGLYLDRGERSIQHRVYRLGLAKNILRRWTEEEDEFIRNSPGQPIKDVARELGRGVSEVSSRWKQIGDGIPWSRRAGYKPVTSGHLVREYVRRGKSSVRRMEHTATMEEHLGRPIRSGEVVHHVNCLKTDNRIENLYLCKDVAHHMQVHRSLELLLPHLLELGIVRFNRDKGVYELCETNK